jgi:archaemetzincin
MRIKWRPALSVAGIVVAVGLLLWHFYFRSYLSLPMLFAGETYVEIEQKLSPLAQRKKVPAHGEWLDRFPEAGQSFQAYVEGQPVRRDRDHHTIYLCLVGQFTPEQERILDINREYMSLFFDSPVKVHKRISLEEIPDRAQRRNPHDGQHQLLTKYFLHELLKVDRPADALAYIAFSSVDLWTKEADGTDWNFVFGQADRSERLGVWSIARFGDPAASGEAFARCLKLTIGTATHETGHILSMNHCVFYECNMNGANHLGEAMRNPLPLCPICLRKLCWNLQLEPRPYLQRLLEFSRKHQMQADVKWYEGAIETLGR